MLPERPEGAGDAALGVDVEKLARDDEEKSVGERSTQGALVRGVKGPVEVDAGGGRSERSVDGCDLQCAHGRNRRAGP
jgi:hypothetical protein